MKSLFSIVIINIKLKLNRIKSISINEIKNEESGKQPYETVEVNQNDFDVNLF